MAEVGKDLRTVEAKGFHLMERTTQVQRDEPTSPKVYPW